MFFFWVVGSGTSTARGLFLSSSFWGTCDFFSIFCCRSAAPNGGLFVVIFAWNNICLKLKGTSKFQFLRSIATSVGISAWKFGLAPSGKLFGLQYWMLKISIFAMPKSGSQYIWANHIVDHPKCCSWIRESPYALHSGLGILVKFAQKSWFCLKLELHSFWIDSTSLVILVGQGQGGSIFLGGRKLQIVALIFPKKTLDLFSSVQFRCLVCMLGGLSIEVVFNRYKVYDTFHGSILGPPALSKLWRNAWFPTWPGKWPWPPIRVCRVLLVII